MLHSLHGKSLQCFTYSIVESLVGVQNDALQFIKSSGQSPCKRSSSSLALRPFVGVMALLSSGFREVHVVLQILFPLKVTFVPSILLTTQGVPVDSILRSLGQQAEPWLVYALIVDDNSSFLKKDDNYYKKLILYPMAH